MSTEQSNPQRRRNEPAVEQQSGHAEGVKETVESIIIAFILAFVFRAFIVEAFVIPTGSMASTLFGKHGALVCEDCGWENVYGLTDTDTRDAYYSAKSPVQCQNCNHVNTDLKIHDKGGRGLDRKVASNAESGDRILVFKWPFDFGGGPLDPQRWDVTVFKNPSDPNENFIKRLIGVPGEVLEILDGDVYSVATAGLSEPTLRILDERRHIKALLSAQAAVPSADLAMFQLPPAAMVLDELADKMRIRTKSPQAQLSLWIPVFDIDYPPRTLDENQPFWTALPPVRGDGWESRERRIVFNGGEGEVRFAGKRIVDHNAYNINLNPKKLCSVSDLRISAVLDPVETGDGFVEFILHKGDSTFGARIMADGHAVLKQSRREVNDSRTLCDEWIAPLEPQRPVRIAFQIVDYCASLHIDGRQVLATNPEQFAPDVRTLRRNPRSMARLPSIVAADMRFDLLHVALHRDVHYTSPGMEETAVRSWARAGWGTTNNPILLREGEFFMMGDNSPASKDSRLWDVVGPHLVDRGEAFQLGTVPADQLVGRAFFVYWPSGLRPGWIPYIGDVGIIPNVGRMRWIR